MSEHGEWGDYLLGDLDDLERARLERRMAEDPELRAHVEQLSPVVERLQGLSSEPWAFVDAEVSPSRPSSPRARGSRMRRPRRRGLFALAGACAVAAVVVLALLLASSSSTTGRTVTLSALAGAPPQASATARITDERHVVMSVRNLPPTDSNHYYELWLMTSRSDLVPVASFQVDRSGDARMSLSLPTSPARYRFLDISRQQAGAGTAISNYSLLRGPTA